MSRLIQRIPLAATGLLAVLAAAIGVLPSPRAEADDAVPYTDPSVVGFVGLCDAADQPIDHGSVAAQPFVRSATSSVAAIAPYDGDGRTATLFAYQPREGTAPTEWSGQLLTASTSYDDPAHPTAVATTGDDSLATFIASYPPQWKGLIQIRLYLSAPGQPPLTQQYSATDIVIDGDSWKVARGGDTPCDSAAAHSLEEILPTTVAVAGAGTEAATSTTGASTTGSSDDGSSDDGGTSTVGKVAIGVGVAVVLGGAASVLERRRRRKPSAP